MVCGTVSLQQCSLGSLWRIRTRFGGFLRCCSFAAARLGCGVELVDSRLLYHGAIRGAATFNGAEKSFKGLGENFISLLIEEAFELITGSMGVILVANALGHLFLYISK